MSILKITRSVQKRLMLLHAYWIPDSSLLFAKHRINCYCSDGKSIINGDVQRAHLFYFINALHAILNRRSGFGKTYFWDFRRRPINGAAIKTGIKQIADRITVMKLKPSEDTNFTIQEKLMTRRAMKLIYAIVFILNLH